MSRPIHLLVNDRPLLGVRTGVGRYLEQLFAAWPQDTVDRIETVCGRVTRSVWRRDAFDGVLASLAPLQLRPLSSLQVQPDCPVSGDTRRGAMRWGYGVAAGARVRTWLTRGGVYFEPNHIPVAPAPHVVVTMHDLSILDVPQYHPADRVRSWEGRFMRGLEWADRFICVSRATGTRLVALGGVDASRIEVIYPGATWTQAPPGWTPTECRKRLGLPDRYVVCLGTIEPRKNHSILLDALQTAIGGDVPQLLLLGSEGWGDERFWSSIVQHASAPRVLLAGHVTDEQAMAALIGSCGLVFPSHYEGFGLPPLEAMSLGRRVAVSTAPSLVEVVGNEGEVVDPADAEGWSKAMVALGDRDAEAEQRAVVQARKFDWPEAARRHRETFAGVVK